MGISAYNLENDYFTYLQKICKRICKKFVNVFTKNSYSYLLKNLLIYYENIEYVIYSNEINKINATGKYMNLSTYLPRFINVFVKIRKRISQNS